MAERADIAMAERDRTAPAEAGSPGALVRDAAFDVMRAFGMTTIFGNPGSTEIAFLTRLPSDIRFVLALHEGAAVGMATGYALATGRPALVNLHTAAGLGNAVNAIANARDSDAPLVILVGQQDRRQLALAPFLSGRDLERVAGDYPVFTTLPARPQDLPGAIARAHHEAATHRGPAIVVVPMGDWTAEADVHAGWAQRTVRATAVSADDLGELIDLVDTARAPAIVVGRADGCEDWAAVTALAERLRCPVYQESFSRRAGFPQDHPQFAGHLPWRRAEIRRTLADHDLALVIGAGAFRLYLLDDDGPLVGSGTRVAVLTADPAEAHRSPSAVAVLAPVAAGCTVLAEHVAARDTPLPPPLARPAAPPPPGPDESLSAAHVLSALAERLPRDAVLVEETPSSQPELYRRIAVRAPGGYLACGNGGLGFGVAGAIGRAMGEPSRPVVGVIGDGSAMYAIQALWSAAHYEVGVLLVIMANGRYAIMDRLARDAGGPGAAPWPAFGSIDIAGMARCLGCPAVNVATHAELVATLDEVLPSLTARREPLVLEVAIGEPRGA
jgi:benzoylformate decarboxylase